MIDCVRVVPGSGDQGDPACLAPEGYVATGQATEDQGVASFPSGQVDPHTADMTEAAMSEAATHQDPAGSLVSLDSWGQASSLLSATGRAPAKLVTPRRKVQVIPRRLSMDLDDSPDPGQAGLSARMGRITAWLQTAPFRAYEGLVMSAVLVIAITAVCALGMLAIGGLSMAMKPYWAVAQMMGSPFNSTLIMNK